MLYVYEVVYVRSFLRLSSMRSRRLDIYVNLYNEGNKLRLQHRLSDRAPLIVNPSPIYSSASPSTPHHAHPSDLGFDDGGRMGVASQLRPQTRLRKLHFFSIRSRGL